MRIIVIVKLWINCYTVDNVENIQIIILRYNNLVRGENMYISKIHIENFRNFRIIDIPLKAFSIIIGENDSGKSNLLDAIRLVLYNNSLNYYSKVLGITDFNKEIVNEFYDYLKSNRLEINQKIGDSQYMKKIYEKIPVVCIRITFLDAQTEYQKQLLKDWMNIDDSDGICYEIEYCFMPQKKKDFIEECLFLIEKTGDFLLPVEKYDYKIYSVNNCKTINRDKAKNFSVSIISAERDTFSESDRQNSYRLVSNLIEKNITRDDRVRIEEAYNKFFADIQDVNSFKSIFDKMQNGDNFKNLMKYIDEMKLIPNFPNLKNIFTNINIGFGDEFLYQKGLGTRNLMYLFLLFSYFHNDSKTFNFLCVEEPEAHLCVNNFNVALDFIKKSIEIQTGFIQLLVTSHNPKVINKLQLNNVVVLKSGKAISFDKVDSELVSYLSKRPNFDILKILFAKRVILVEGPTEEMYINTLLDLDKVNIIEIEVISIGQKGYKKFLDIWLLLHKEDSSSCIGVVRDFDNQPKAREEHDQYDINNKNIFVRTTEKYTFEDDLVAAGDNEILIKAHLGISNDVADELKSNKADNMRMLCEAIIDEKITLDVPKHIGEIISCVKNY